MNKILLKEIPESVCNYFKGMDSYDDPCFMLISTDKSMTPLMDKIDSIVGSNKSSENISILINDTLYFASLDCSNKKIHSIISKVQKGMRKVDVNTHISAFRHNCLGEPEKTFLWCGMLLDEVFDEYGSESGYKINDFQDRNNWPGIDKYMK